MKSEKNNPLESTANHLKSFIKGLKEVSEELSEQEFEQYLEIDILPGLLEDKAVYDDTIWNKMDIAKAVGIDSILEERGLPMENAIRKMNVDAVCWLLDHLWATKGVISDSKAVESRYLNSLKEDCLQLQEWINGDLYERLQDYQHEIKNHQEE